MAVAAACQVDPKVPDDAQIRCDAEGEGEACPAGFRCLGEAGFCVPTVSRDHTNPSPCRPS